MLGHKEIMSEEFRTSILALPILLIYRILDNLDEFNLVCSMWNVCTRFNAVMETYPRWEVKRKTSSY